MTSNCDLIQLFADYYEQPRGNWPALFNGLQTYDFEDHQLLQDEVLAITPMVECDPDPQRSNTGTPYTFDPAFLKADVEIFLRGLDTVEHFFVWDQIKRPNLHFKESVGLAIGKIQHVILVTDIWHQTKTVADYINRTCSQKTHILGYANALWQMMANEEFLDAVKGSIKGFINTDGPAFINTTLSQNFTFNDQMINWKSGVNFFTCSHNRKHFLPIFAARNGGYYNLLNLKRFWIPVDDLFEVQGFEDCACGKPAPILNFIPHVSNFIDYRQVMGMANHLNSKFRWIQIVQHKDIKVMYETSLGTDITPEDVATIKKLGDVSFHKGDYLQIGNKFPSFWKINKFM